MGLVVKGSDSGDKDSQHPIKSYCTALLCPTAASPGAVVWDPDGEHRQREAAHSGPVLQEASSHGCCLCEVHHFHSDYTRTLRTKWPHTAQLDGTKREYRDPSTQP